MSRFTDAAAIWSVLPLIDAEIKTCGMTDHGSPERKTVDQLATVRANLRVEAIRLATQTPPEKAVLDAQAALDRAPAAQTHDTEDLRKFMHEALEVARNCRRALAFSLTYVGGSRLENSECAAGIEAADAELCKLLPGSTPIRRKP